MYHSALKTGINQLKVSNLINKFISEKVVSGSDVLNSSHPIKKIMKLQTVARYEK